MYFWIILFAVNSFTNIVVFQNKFNSKIITEIIEFEALHTCGCIEGKDFVFLIIDLEAPSNILLFDYIKSIIEEYENGSCT